MAFPKCKHCNGKGCESYCLKPDWPKDLPKDACHICGGYGYIIPENRYQKAARDRRYSSLGE